MDNKCDVVVELRALHVSVGNMLIPEVERICERGAKEIEQLRARLIVEVFPEVIASKIRELLEGLSPEQVRDALDMSGYCLDCGHDKKLPDGTIAHCHCRNDD
jgi:hypothetical protein